MGCTILIVIGGLPCQDVPILNGIRAGVCVKRSGLFRVGVRVARFAAELAAAFFFQFVGFGECTCVGKADRDPISSELAG